MWEREDGLAMPSSLQNEMLTLTLAGCHIQSVTKGGFSNVAPATTPGPIRLPCIAAHAVASFGKGNGACALAVGDWAKETVAMAMTRQFRIVRVITPTPVISLIKPHRFRACK
jgi:hypothetical protein